MEKDLNDKGINISKRWLTIEEAIPFFPGSDDGHVKEKSLRVKVSTGRVPKGSVKRLPTGMLVFDKLKLMGF